MDDLVIWRYRRGNVFWLNDVKPSEELAFQYVRTIDREVLTMSMYSFAAFILEVPPSPERMAS